MEVILSRASLNYNKKHPWTGKKPAIRLCYGCFKPFSTLTFPEQVCCSQKCSGKITSNKFCLRNYTAKKRRGNKDCFVCGTSFFSSGRKTCSDKCCIQGQALQAKRTYDLAKAAGKPRFPIVNKVPTVSWCRGKTHKDLLGEERATQLAKKQGASIRKKIIAGLYHPQDNYRRKKVSINTKKGGIVSYSSKWELVYIKYLEDNPLVSKFEKDKVRLLYKVGAAEYIYIVDFLITYTDGNTDLVEVKPESFLVEEKTKAKFECAKNWCQQNGISFSIVTEYDIKELNGGLLP